MGNIIAESDGISFLTTSDHALKVDFGPHHPRHISKRCFVYDPKK